MCLFTETLHGNSLIGSRLGVSRVAISSTIFGSLLQTRTDDKNSQMLTCDKLRYKVSTISNSYVNYSIKQDRGHNKLRCSGTKLSILVTSWDDVLSGQRLARSYFFDFVLVDFFCLLPSCFSTSAALLSTTWIISWIKPSRSLSDA